MSPNQALRQTCTEHQWHILVVLLKGTPQPLRHIVPEQRPTMMLSCNKLRRTQAAPVASQEAV